MFTYYESCTPVYIDEPPILVNKNCIPTGPKQLPWHLLTRLVPYPFRIALDRDAWHFCCPENNLLVYKVDNNDKSMWNKSLKFEIIYNWLETPFFSGALFPFPTRSTYDYFLHLSNFWLNKTNFKLIKQISKNQKKRKLLDLLPKHKYDEYGKVWDLETI